MGQGQRPLGVTIVGILYFLLGLLFVFAGIGLVAVGSLSSIDFTDVWGEWGSGIIVALGAILLLLGLFYLLIGIGCFKGWGWVWTLAVIMTILGLILQLTSTFMRSTISTSDIISLVVSLTISILILWYLFRQNVKAWFGKA